MLEAVFGNATQSDVAQQFHVNQMTVSRLVPKFKARMDFYDRPRPRRLDNRAMHKKRVIEENEQPILDKPSLILPEKHRVELSSKICGASLK